LVRCADGVGREEAGGGTEDEATIAGEGEPPTGLGSIDLVGTDSMDLPPQEMPVSGFGVLTSCPTAVISCAEGEEVTPPLTVHLQGDKSYSENGPIVEWEWSVEQPEYGSGMFIPSSSFPNPTFLVGTASVYVFRLRVWDDQGIESCAQAEYEVVGCGCGDEIHVELLWKTPDDADETDTGPGVGSDLDLHFLHPEAGGPDLDGDGHPDGWFDVYRDCFWFNAHPNWGSFDPSINDDPGLDRDDSDGAGPENINLSIPEYLSYRVGVHYHDANGYGAAFATVRVHIYSQLVFELADVMLVDSDMWEVATIDWPSGKVNLLLTPDGQYKITPDYHNPFFSQ
jgi:hypothetical protein